MGWIRLGVGRSTFEGVGENKILGYGILHVGEGSVVFMWNLRTGSQWRGGEGPVYGVWRIGGTEKRGKIKREEEPSRRIPSTRSKEPRTSCPLFVPASKGGLIATRLRMEEENLAKATGWKYKIVERGGRQLKDLLTKSNIFGKEKCGREKCMACKDMK